MPKVKISWEVGETTCANSAGEMCKWVRTSHFGTRFRCLLFEGSLVDKDGWLLRNKQCLKLEKIDDDITFNSAPPSPRCPDCPILEDCPGEDECPYVYNNYGKF